MLTSFGDREETRQIVREAERQRAMDLEEGLRQEKVLKLYALKRRIYRRAPPLL